MVSSSRKSRSRHLFLLYFICVLCIFFFQAAKKKAQELDSGLAEINDLTKQLAQYFCEDEGKLKLQELLSLFKTFCDQLITAKKVKRKKLNPYLFE